MDADLKFYIGATEYGTIGNPIVFTGALAGQTLLHPLNPFYLYNDKGGVLGSVQAREIQIQVLNMWIQNELLGVSTGIADQTFTCDFIPIVDNVNPEEIIVTVGTTIWTRIGSLAGTSPLSEVYTINPTTGLVTFGNGVFGLIPPLGENITITYMPNTLVYGKEVFENTWLEIKSLGVTANTVTVIDELKNATDTTHITVANAVVNSVSGVWLSTDVLHTGTNYYTGGSYVANSGILTLGTALPTATSPCLINYTYVGKDDLETNFIQLGYNVTHTFENPIPQNNAKLLYLGLVVPAPATASGSQVAFRIRLTYKQ